MATVPCRAIARARENGLSEAIGDAPMGGMAPGLQTKTSVVVGGAKTSPYAFPEQQKVTITLRDSRPPLNKVVIGWPVVTLNLASYPDLPRYILYLEVKRSRHLIVVARNSS